MPGDKVEIADSSLTSEKFLMSKAELAAKTGVSASTIDRDRRDGLLIATKIRGRVMFRQTHIEKWLGSKKRSQRNVS